MEFHNRPTDGQQCGYLPITADATGFKFCTKCGWSDGDAPKRRATFLLQSDLAELDAWCARVRTMFMHEMPYLVGSALTSPNWRDVDVRVILDDDVYDDLARKIVPAMLNLSVSVWGRKATGLPIDFQIQRMTDANAEFSGRRNAMGVSVSNPQVPTEEDNDG